MDKIKVGIIGFGYSARVFHAPHLINNPNYEVIAVLERNSEKALEYFPSAKIIRNIDDFLKENIELIFITTPNQTHYEYAKKALLANKNVVVEKPICNTVQEALELKKLAEENNLLLTVYQNRRYDSAIISAQEIIRQNLIGEIVDCEIRFERYTTEKNKKLWKETGELGTGLVYDLGVHLIDQALYLFGYPKALFADIRYQHENAISDDNFFINLYYENGLIVRLNASKYAKSPNRHFALHGKNGSYIQNEVDSQEALLGNWDKKALPNFPAKGFLTNQNGESAFARTGNYAYFYQNLAESWQNQTLLAVKMEEVIRVLGLIEAVFISARDNKKFFLSDLSKFVA